MQGVGSASPSRPDWQPGKRISLSGQKKLVVLGGAGSRTGDAERAFSLLFRHLKTHAGFMDGDLLEASYTGELGAHSWVPRPYEPAHTRQQLSESAEAVAACLNWYRSVLQPDAHLYFIGYSLGGVVGFDGATLAFAQNRKAWQNHLRGLVTVASPIRGSNLGPLLPWAWLVTPDIQGLGAAGEDLRHRWIDAAEQERLQRRADFLRANGVAVLTLADPDDAIIRPDEALLLIDQPPEQLLLRTTRVRTRSHGHGVVLDEPAFWMRVADFVGHQTPATHSVPPFVDPLDTELAAIKEKLRREGRLPRNQAT